MSLLSKSSGSPRRNIIIMRSALILALPAVANVLTLWVLSLFLGDSFVLFSHASEAPAWGGQAIISMLVVMVTALAFLRFGQPNISAVLLLLFWTVAVTLVTVRLGANTYLPAMMILPIGIATLLFNQRVGITLALISAGVVWLSVYLLLSRVEPIMYDFVRGEVVTNPRQILIYSAISGTFWSVLYLAVAAITAMMAGDLQRSLRQSAATATAFKELSDQLEHRVSLQTATLLAGEREKAMLAERTRLAREIHDTLAQGLVGIIVQLGAANQALRAGHVDVTQHVELATKMARESLAEARRSVWNLRSEALERGDLRDALRHLVNHFPHPTIKAQFECHGDWCDLPVDVESALLRVAQEALANVARHAAATTVILTLECTPTAIQLVIRDDGQGFGDHLEHVASSAHANFGILGMRERIAALHGTLQLYNSHGAVVDARVPRTPRKDDVV
jgi:signal transduction histidine kinase